MTRPLTRRSLLTRAAAAAAGAGTLHRPASRAAAGEAGADRDHPPNLILILCDNLGYGDPACYGNPLHRTPHVDRLAEEGVRFTDFYATSGVCTPSRASIMTGCYPRRVGMHADEHGALVLRPVAHKGLHPDEVTLAEVLKGRGYATAIVGKWHLANRPCTYPSTVV